MKLNEAIVKAREELQAVLGRDVSNIIAASRKDDGWLCTVELVERKAIPDTQDLLGTYEVLLDETGDLTSYERIGVRKRMDLEAFAE